ncbi:Sulfatase-modifying factor enzyme 1 [Tistlia consotensis]|uniref:Sulfatase-modifying factor enzyme 1 n=1 Tax=Tistlia consotensis USBA 355 TaxID=560819 RepID=A0A1Y6CNB2_9PROT|nr:SUMF1/EgtB/PvdO family nonheme iron enzyme [Tistlia consotensis]SMF66138.1 Sulfatase-modifying factor enzyme 1 [Tistlia consotensis USBA 355]SNS02644.1 Sulfatase-modifying factor enzyme 1 [Tistlia consotensis]
MDSLPALLAGGVAGLLLWLAAGSPARSAPPPEWREQLWNPVPMSDDVVLPLPCGGALALRRIDTTLPGNWLTDFRVQLGSATSSNPYSSFTRFAYVAGSLSDGNDPGRRYYLLGKYEVTEDQYAAVMGATCPKPSMRGRLPKAGVSWFEAVEFTRRLTVWLNRTAPDTLPEQDGQRSFLRLPTETEWEFAARGGRAVGEADFRRPLFPMPEGDLSRYAWFQGPRSCSGDLQLVGRLRPNPLGLFDILGNVEEIMLEPYRLNRGGRLHGQNGGFVVKGGSCWTDESAISTALRTEFSYYNDRTGQPLAPPSAGIRVEVAAPVLVSHQRIGQLDEDWREAVEAGTSASLPADVDPAETLRQLAEKTSDFEIRGELSQLAAVVRSRDSARADIERRAIQTAIESGAFIIRQYIDDAHDLAGIQGVVKLLGDPGNDPEAQAELANYKKLIEVTQHRLKLTLNVYTAVLAQSAADYAPGLASDQLKIVTDRFDRIEGPVLSRYADVFAGHLQRWQERGGLEIAVIKKDLDQL